MAKEILEYKMDANDSGNAIVPGFVDHKDCGYFYNPTNHTYIGLRLADWVKVPDTVVKLTKAQLKTRNYAEGICMKMLNGELVQMTQEEIDNLVDAWCEEREIE